ncbi:MAG: phosphate acyltransferase PlsX [Myxococcales bacterium FL481]|nr:MAG: phosphate acyltransferase PlsX [Myxococcales bacterium FL481]
MLSSPRIALDAFGGDNCPATELEAAVAAARTGLRVLLVGDAAELEPRLATLAGQDNLPIEVHHAPDRISMSDSPSKAVRGKPTASMPVCFDLVKSGRADAVVSAGNSGAMLACGLFKYGRVEGVDRPAITVPFPTLKQKYTWLLDMGANVDCRALNLVQFAVMGSVYARVNGSKSRPIVALLSNGTEPGKGTELTRAAHRILSAHPSVDFEYAGYIEGNNVFDGAADVIVTDGYSGNVALKIVEGTTTAFTTFLRRAIKERHLTQVGALMMKPAFAMVKELLDSDSYGGAPLLGIDGVAIICHGGSSSMALANGIRVAASFVDQGLTPGLTEAIARNQRLFAAAKELG